MKKMISILLCMAMAVSLAACSRSDGSGSTGVDSSAVTSTQPVASDSSAVPEELSEEDGSASAEPAPEESGEGDSSEAQPEETGSSGVSVSFETVTDTVTAEDGTDVLDLSFDQPTVTVEGSEAAQEAIQADLDQRLSDILDYAYSEMKSIALETYEFQTEYSGEVTGSFLQVSMSTMRADSAVLSIVMETATYSGGAHPYSSRIGLNYDVTTGERLTFDKLGSGFRAAAEEKVLEKADAHQAETGDLFDEYADYIPLVVADGTESLQEIYEQLWPDLYGEDADESMAMDPVEGSPEPRFYLDETGANFISNYEMGPYAAGIMEFHVDYSDFGDAFNSAYLPG